MSDHARSSLSVFTFNRVERIADRDWVKEVQEGWKPIRLGDKLVIRFTWHQDEVNGIRKNGHVMTTAEHASRYVSLHNNHNHYIQDLEPFKDIDNLQLMTLEGGAAFGSGEHPTTSMCCEWLESHLKAERRAGRSPSVIDYGSGSGILAMAALMFGADSAIGVEIDPIAIMSAYRNAEMNEIEMLHLPVS